MPPRYGPVRPVRFVVMLRRLPLLVGAGLVIAACSASDDGEPPPATRATVPVRETTPTTTVADDGSGPGESSGPTATTSAPTTTVAPFEFTLDLEPGAAIPGGGQLPDDVDGGFVAVPLDYDDPQGATLDIWVTRRRADPDDRIGVLVANNGGPGVAASMIGINATGWFEDEIVERFDIVSFDPRGTGLSGGSVDCIDDDEYDLYYATGDITPETAAEKQELVDQAETFASQCVERVGADVLPHLGTNNTARDIDAIRQALGEDQITYFGYSYGSELGAVWTTFFPDTVRAAVLDGARHPDPDGLEPTKQQWLGFENVFNTFLAACSADTDCAFHNDGDAEGAFDDLLAGLDDEPLDGPEGRADITQTVAINGVVQAMYSDRTWPALERALADAADGNGAGLLALHDGYFRRRPDGSYTNLLESFQAITCADEPDRLTVEEADEQAEELIGVAPRLFPGTTGSYTCDFFPESADPRAVITGERAGPIVVIGTTGDPSTPLASSQAMADTLEEGVLVTVEANQHTAYRSGRCINDVVHEYLVWLEVPEAGTRCR